MDKSSSTDGLCLMIDRLVDSFLSSAGVTTGRDTANQGSFITGLIYIIARPARVVQRILGA